MTAFFQILSNSFAYHYHPIVYYIFDNTASLIGPEKNKILVYGREAEIQLLLCMQAYVGFEVSPLIHSLGTKLPEWSAWQTVRPRFSPNMRLGGTQSRSGRFRRRDKPVCPTKKQSRILGHPAVSLVTTPTTLSRIWHSEDRASRYILIIKPTRCTNFSNLFLV